MVPAEVVRRSSRGTAEGQIERQACLLSGKQNFKNEGAEMIGQMIRTVVTELDWPLIIAGGSTIAVVVIAVREGISWWNERPSIEAFLRPTTENRVSLFIVNTGRRVAKKVRYSFIPQAPVDTYEKYGCILQFTTPSAPFTLIKEYPVEIWITNLFVAWNNGEPMPPLQVKITRKRTILRDKKQVFELDVRTLLNISFTEPIVNKILRKIDKEHGIFGNISRMAKELAKYFGGKNIAKENECELLEHKCPHCFQNLIWYTHSSGEINAKHKVCPSALPNYNKKQHQ